MSPMRAAGSSRRARARTRTRTGSRFRYGVPGSAARCRMCGWKTPTIRNCDFRCRCGWGRRRMSISRIMSSAGTARSARRIARLRPGVRRSRPTTSPRTEIRPGANKALLKQIGALGDAELAGLLFAVDRDILLQRFSRYEKTGDWERLAAFKRVVIGAPVEQLLTLVRTLGRQGAQPRARRARDGGPQRRCIRNPSRRTIWRARPRRCRASSTRPLRYLRVADRLEQDGARAKREMAV